MAEPAQDGPHFFVLKVAVQNPASHHFALRAQKTMYGGKRAKPGDVLYLIDSEREGGAGLVMRARITAVEQTPRLTGVARQTPRVSIAFECDRRAERRFGRADLLDAAAAPDDPRGELQFKLYRQATDKLVGIRGETARFLDRYLAAVDTA